MSLRAIAAALGGDFYENGCRASVPAPGHGAADRSVSLVMSEGRVVVHSFGGADWREVLDDLRSKGLIDRAARPTDGGRVTAPSRPDSRLRLETARNLWACGVDTGAEGLVARHLRRRGVIWNPEVLDLREHPAAPLSIYGGGSRRQRAMMARISDPEGATTAVELTYLNPGGGQAVDLRVSRKTVGRVPAGSAVRLSQTAAALLVGEGVVTTLSAMTWFRRPGWALLSAGNLARWRAPEGVETVIIAGDRGAVGEAAAQALNDRLHADGLTSTVVLPWEPWGDWNEALNALALERRKKGGGSALEERGWALRLAGN